MIWIYRASLLQPFKDCPTDSPGGSGIPYLDLSFSTLYICRIKKARQPHRYPIDFDRYSRFPENSFVDHVLHHLRQRLDQMPPLINRRCSPRRHHGPRDEIAGEGIEM